MPSPSASATASGPARASGVVPARLSAQRLHELAVEAFRIGNRGRLSLCESLRVLSETRLFFDLGFPSVAAYADAFFQLRRADAFDYVRVANALLELTELRDAFARGAIGWSVLRAVTRVASIASQASWIDFARRNGGERTIAEARDAQRRGRDTPRKTSFGLPNLDQRLVLRFARSDMEKVRAWIDGACATVEEKTGTQGVSVEQAILFLCEQSMASATVADDPKTAQAGGAGVNSGPQRAQIVYQRCTDCRRTRMGTREGFVEVASDEVERYAGCAEPVVLDGPTPPRLRRQILAREAGRCGNPRCGNRADHCHHKVLLSEGGKTCLANEVAVCTTCHALIHAGLLRVTTDATGDARWSPIGAGDALDHAVAADRAAADELPVLHFQAERRAAAATPGGSGESAAADSPPGFATADSSPRSTAADSLPKSAAVDSPPPEAAGCGLDLEALAHGLVRLGVPVARSRRLIRAAIEALPRSGLTEAGVLRKALAAI